MESTGPKVYLVIPNKGEISVSLVKPIFTMATDKRFRVTLCDLVKSNRMGVTYNKNATVRDFLKTDCEWYVSLDSDQVPLCNPLDLVLSEREIIGLPTPICDNKFVVWNVFVESQIDKEKFSPLQLDKSRLEAEGYPDLIECHAVGGGCIIVRRDVFEKVFPPFLDVIGKDGGLDREHDLEFCRRAREAGFKVFFSPYYRCEHFKNVPMLDYLKIKNRLFIQEEPRNG